MTPVVFIALTALALASGYAAYVWIGESRAATKRHHPGTAAGYGLLALTNLADTVVISLSLAGHPLTLPQGSAALLLAPIIVVPAFLVHRARRRTITLLDQTRSDG